jgi:hypothetical protein
VLLFERVLDFTGRLHHLDTDQALIHDLIGTAETSARPTKHV